MTTELDTPNSAKQEWLHMICFVLGPKAIRRAHERYSNYNRNPGLLAQFNQIVLAIADQATTIGEIRDLFDRRLLTWDAENLLLEKWVKLALKEIERANTPQAAVEIAYKRTPGWNWYQRSRFSRPYPWGSETADAALMKGIDLCQNFTDALYLERNANYANDKVRNSALEKLLSYCDTLEMARQHYLGRYGRYRPHEQVQDGLQSILYKKWFSLCQSPADLREVYEHTPYPPTPPDD